MAAVQIRTLFDFQLSDHHTLEKPEDAPEGAGVT